LLWKENTGALIYFLEILVYLIFESSTIGFGMILLMLKHTIK
jgi:hypothetical protein